MGVRGGSEGGQRGVRGGSEGGQRGITRPLLPFSVADAVMPHLTASMLAFCASSKGLTLVQYQLKGGLKHLLQWGNNYA